MSVLISFSVDSHHGKTHDMLIHQLQLTCNGVFSSVTNNSQTFELAYITKLHKHYQPHPGFLGEVGKGESIFCVSKIKQT